MVEISEEVYMQERRRRRKPVELGQTREHEKSDREGKGLAEQAGTDSLSGISNRAHSTNDVMRPNDRDEDQARRAGTDMMIRQSRVEKGLVNHA